MSYSNTILDCICYFNWFAAFKVQGLSDVFSHFHSCSTLKFWQLLLSLLLQELHLHFYFKISHNLSLYKEGMYYYQLLVDVVGWHADGSILTKANWGHVLQSSSLRPTMGSLSWHRNSSFGHNNLTAAPSEGPVQRARLLFAMLALSSC